MYDLIIKPGAEEDISEIFSWYNLKKPGLGIQFIDCLDEALISVKLFPQDNFNVLKNVRRKTIRRFPYNIYYTKKANLFCACYYASLPQADRVEQADSQ